MTTPALFPMSLVTALRRLRTKEPDRYAKLLDDFGVADAREIDESMFERATVRCQALLVEADDDPAAKPAPARYGVLNDKPAEPAKPTVRDQLNKLALDRYERDNPMGDLVKGTTGTAEAMKKLSWGLKVKQ